MITDSIFVLFVVFAAYFGVICASAIAIVMLTHPYLTAGLLITGAVIGFMAWPKSDRGGI